MTFLDDYEAETESARMIREREEQRAAALAATADVEEAAAAIGWLRDRLVELLRWADGAFRRVEVESQLRMLALHKPVPVEGWDRQVYGCRAKCDGESWSCYTDGEEVVRSPCLHVKLLARPFDGLAEGFPAHLRLPDDEISE